jgi:transcriptional regulator with XRE-family HTH domain
VVRCQECLLVQFRTQSDRCRRCAKALPTFLPFQEAPPVEQIDTASSEDYGDAATPMDRATRNRRITVGAKIKMIREQRNLTQVEMSELLGIPRSYLSRIENSRLLPGPLMVASFATALEIDIAELLGVNQGRRAEDAAERALLNGFAALPIQKMEDVLRAARQMVAQRAVAKVIPLTAAGSLRAVQPLRPTPTRT